MTHKENTNWLRGNDFINPLWLASLHSLGQGVWKERIRPSCTPEMTFWTPEIWWGPCETSVYRLYLYYLGADLRFDVDNMPGPHERCPWLSEYSLGAGRFWVHTWVCVSSSPQDFQQALCEITCPFLYLFLFLWSGDISDHHLVMFMKLHQTFVWKTLLTVMPAWFLTWLQENGGGGRAPNIASAFIFDIIKRSPGWGPDWSFLEYKMQTCAFCWWGARECSPSPRPVLHFHGMHSCQEEHLSPGDFVQGLSWVRGGAKKELTHGIWSPPLPDLRRSGLPARPSAYEWCPLEWPFPPAPASFQKQSSVWINSQMTELF